MPESNPFVLMSETNIYRLSSTCLSRGIFLYSQIFRILTASCAKNKHQSRHIGTRTCFKSEIKRLLDIRGIIIMRALIDLPPLTQSVSKVIDQ